MNLYHAAMGDHPKGKDEVETDAKNPSDQKPRHAAQFADILRQQNSDRDAGENRQEKPWPRGNDAQEQRPFLGCCRHRFPPRQDCS
jgi:hypothetical protein